MVLGTIKGRHEMPVKDYILTEVKDPSAVDEITDTVNKRLAELFSPYIKKGTVNIPNAAEYVDVPAYISSENLDLYVTGLTSVVLAVAGFCARSGISLTAYHYNSLTGGYIPQKVL